jgi:D-alanine-D-alanine ligase
MKKTVAILFGGESSEYEVSCISAANVAENLDKELYEPLLVGITKDGERIQIFENGNWAF